MLITNLTTLVKQKNITHADFKDKNLDKVRFFKIFSLPVV